MGEKQALQKLRSFPVVCAECGKGPMWELTRFGGTLSVKQCLFYYPVPCFSVQSCFVTLFGNGSFVVF